MSTSRLESFSDGVIAVAITLLSLGLVVPSHGHGSLAHNLGHNWPSYAAYVVSFLTIGIIWINHHVMIGRISRPDHSVLMHNLWLLMTIGVLPFVTDLVASYLRSGSDAKLATAVYCAAFAVMGATFCFFNWFMLFHRTELLVDESVLPVRVSIIRRNVAGVAPYLIAVGIAFISPYAALAICGVVAIFYALPFAAGPVAGTPRGG
jgi:uncharacterized membrane protein